MRDAIGWLLTWSTYGTWLHGDKRGSYDRSARRPAPRFVAPNIRFEALRRSQLKYPPLLIEPAMRRVIRVAIEGECEFWHWTLHALNVRTNHVHAVVDSATSPTRMLQAIKAKATRNLREEGLTEAGRPVWTPGGSRTWLLNPQELADAIDYTRNQQGPDLPEA